MPILETCLDRTTMTSLPLTRQLQWKYPFFVSNGRCIQIPVLSQIPYPLPRPSVL